MMACWAHALRGCDRKRDRRRMEIGRKRPRRAILGGSRSDAFGQRVAHRHKDADRARGRRGRGEAAGLGGQLCGSGGVHRRCASVASGRCRIRFRDLADRAAQRARANLRELEQPRRSPTPSSPGLLCPGKPPYREANCGSPIRPRAGWFPSSLLVSEIALLVFLELAFRLRHARSEPRACNARARLLATARRRVHSANQQLADGDAAAADLQETFEHARFHDMFTGLPNRRYFMDRARPGAARGAHGSGCVRLAVIIVDISRFKLINHMLGHTAGDDLMVQVARRFEEMHVRARRTRSRDGAVSSLRVLLLDVESARCGARRGQSLQEQLRAPFHLRRHQLSVAATLGVTCMESGQERAEDVMREADIALSVAKTQETTKAVLYAPHMGGQAAESREPRCRLARRACKSSSCGCCSNPSSISRPARWWAPRLCCAGGIRWRACCARSVPAQCGRGGIDGPDHPLGRFKR